MSEQPRQVMVEVTDEFGNVESEPLYIALQGPLVRLEVDGKVMRGLVDEFAEEGVRFDTDSEEQAA